MDEFEWNGDAVKQEVLENMSKAMGELALEVEVSSERELRKGHGLLFGDLRRSIHSALPGYDWGADDVEGGPDRGGQLIEAEINGDQVSIQVGSGLAYAMPINQGWPEGYKKMHGSFIGYHFMNNGLNKAKGDIDSILARHQV
jgi:hypothetical protein